MLVTPKAYCWWHSVGGIVGGRVVARCKMEIVDVQLGSMAGAFRDIMP